MAKIAVIGDVMLDKYVYCKNRINPESSAPAYTVVKEEYKPGGAGNAAANLVSLGDEVLLIGLIGKDEHGEILKDKLTEQGINFCSLENGTRQTIVKERALSASDGRYHHRLDREEVINLNTNHVDEIISKVEEQGAEIVLISDYNKGVVSEKLMNRLRDLNIKVIVDPKPDHLEFYSGVFVIKPNGKEIREMAGMEDDVEAAKKLVKDLKSNILLSRGEKGISYFGVNGERYDFPAEAKEVFDVTGAGDSSIAAFTHFYAKGLPIGECVRLANKAGAVSVGHSGCYCVRENELV